MNEPLTDEDLRWALANYKDTDWRYLAAAEIRQLRRELADAKAEAEAFRQRCIGYEIRLGMYKVAEDRGNE